MRFLWGLLILTVFATGCITRSETPVTSANGPSSSTTKLKTIKMSISGAPFAAAPGAESSVSGPKLRKRDTVAILVEALDTEMQPVTFSFDCPQLDVKQESKSPQFEFAVTDVLMKKGFVEVNVQVNGREPLKIHFDIGKP